MTIPPDPYKTVPLFFDTAPATCYTPYMPRPQKKSKKGASSEVTPTPKRHLSRVAALKAAGKIRMVAAMRDAHNFTVRAAATSAQINFTTHYEWLKEDEEYKKLIGDAIEFQTQGLEQSVEERARGINADRPSDVLSIFLLNAKRPDVYRPKTKIEHSGDVSIKTLLLTDDEDKK